MSNPGPTPPSDRFQELRDVLFDEDQQRIVELSEEVRLLKQQLTEKEKLIQTLEPVITDLLDRKISQSKETVAKSLGPVIAYAIRHQIANAKEDIIDALYPILGQLVTRSVSEAMKTLVENINQSLERTFDFDLWVKRLKAKVLRIDQGSVVIAHSMPFELHSLFLIYRESGLLVAYHQKDGASDDDARVIGGMLTAIKSFVENAFSGAKDGDLSEVRYSDRTIRLTSGRYSYLASVYSGVPGSTFDNHLKECHSRIHSRYFRQLRDYSGDNSPLQGITIPLKELFKQYR